MTRPDLSLGGFISTTLVPNSNFGNLFSDISYYSISENRDEFIAIGLLNETGINLKNVTMHFIYPEGCQKHIEVAPVAFNSNGEIEVIPSTYDRPYNAEFYEADGEENAINIGDILIGGKVGLWFKKVIDVPAILDEYSDVNMVLNGTPVASNEDIQLVLSYNHLPIVTTTIITSITDTTAVSGGNVTTDGDLDVIAKGICWSETENPTVDDNVIISTEIGEGVYVSNITGLTTDTTYYVRAYAENSLGVSYGEQVSFTTV